MAMENSPQFNTGEKPGNGIYQCRFCGKFATIKSPDEVLPDCPKCKKPTTYFKKT